MADIFLDISEMIGSSVPKLLNFFFMKHKTVTVAENFKIKQSNTLQSKDKLFLLFEISV